MSRRSVLFGFVGFIFFGVLRIVEVVIFWIVVLMRILFLVRRIFFLVSLVVCF